MADAPSLPRLIMRTVPATPVCPEYRALCVDTGARPPPQVAEIDGRRCYPVSWDAISRRQQGRTSYTVVFVRWLDDGTAGRLTSTEWARKAKTPKPLPGDPT